MRMPVVLAMFIAWPAAAAAETSLHLCPIVGPFGSTVELSGPDRWSAHLPRGDMEMFASGDTVFCKYNRGDLLLTKKVEASTCVLGSEGGKISAPPRFPESTVCSFRDELMRKPRDCFVICK